MLSLVQQCSNAGSGVSPEGIAAGMPEGAGCITAAVLLGCAVSVSAAELSSDVSAKDWLGG